MRHPNQDPLDPRRRDDDPNQESAREPNTPQANAEQQSATHLMNDKVKHQQEQFLGPVLKSPRYKPYEKLEVNRPDGDKKTELHKAATDGKTDLVRYLLWRDTAGRNIINEKDNKGWTALDWAADNGHAGVVKQLFEGGANIEKDNTGKTALHRAAEKGNLAIMRQLISKGETKVYQDGDNNSLTPFQYALNSGTSEIVRILLKLPARKSAYSNKELFHMGVKSGRVEMVRLILEMVKPEINAEDDVTERTALQIAADKGFDEIVCALLEQQNIRVNTADSSGFTALHRAADKDHPEVICLLLNKGATLDISNKNGDTPLHWAAGSNSYEAALQLLKSCVEKVNDDKALSTFVNKKNGLGTTALHEAAKNGHKDLVWLLLSKSADLGLQNNQNQTALSLAAGHEKEDVLELLLERYDEHLKAEEAKKAGGEVKKAWEEVKKALEEAIRGKHPNVVRTLLGKLLQAEIEELPESKLNRKAFLGLAARSGNVEVIKLLEEKLLTK
jgi:ankyrin repeat protein